jgi:hypothetical protein
MNKLASTPEAESAAPPVVIPRPGRGPQSRSAVVRALRTQRARLVALGAERLAELVIERDRWIDEATSEMLDISDLLEDSDGEEFEEAMGWLRDSANDIDRRQLAAGFANLTIAPYVKAPKK